MELKLLSSIWSMVASFILFIFLLEKRGMVFGVCPSSSDWGEMTNVLMLNDTNGRGIPLVYNANESSLKSTVIVAPPGNGILLSIHTLSAFIINQADDYDDDESSSDPNLSSTSFDDHPVGVKERFYIQDCGTRGSRNCDNFIALINELNEQCSLLIPNEMIVMNFQGSVELEVLPISINHDEGSCFSDLVHPTNMPYDMRNVTHLPLCTHVFKAYDEVFQIKTNLINSTIRPNPFFCDLRFDLFTSAEFPRCSPNCSCSLASLEFSVICPDDQARNRSIFILYPTYVVTHLYADSRQIVSIKSDTFDRELDNLLFLYLQNNRLSYFENGTFEELSCLIELDLSGNRLQYLPDYVFNYLFGLRQLQLGNNQLEHIHQNTFYWLIDLRKLNLSGNQLRNLTNHIFNDLLSLKELYLNKTNLQFINPGDLYGLYNLIILDLSGNNLSEITREMFDGILFLEILSIQNNMINNICHKAFGDLITLKVIHLQDNYLQTLKVGIFNDLFRLTQLNIHSNQLTTIEQGAFKYLPKLRHLNLHSNHLTNLERGIFDGLDSLVRLRLSHNNVNTVDPLCFKDLDDLQWLSLDNNTLINLPTGVFYGLFSMETLFLGHNSLSEFSADVFQECHNCTSDIDEYHVYDSYSTINLSSNSLNDMDGNIFKICPNLTTLIITDNPLKRVHEETFNEIGGSSVKVFVTEYSTCCFIEDARCFASEPKPPQQTCGRLLSHLLLKIFMWILGICALMGNVFVLLWRICGKSKENAVQAVIISNLAVSDFLMGVYMIIITSADVHFGEFFPAEANRWRQGIVCKFAGTLSLLSSQASVFFVTLISIERLIIITRPFSRLQLGRISCRVVVGCLWSLAFVLSILPNVANENANFYANSEVCIGLPLSQRSIYNSSLQNNQVSIKETTGGRESISNDYLFYFSFNASFDFYGFYSDLSANQDPDSDEIPYYNFEVDVNEKIGSGPGMFYAIALFLGVNFVCCIVIALCYIAIFIAVYNSGRRSNRPEHARQEIRLAVRMAAIVFTDFFCWMPIIILGIAVQSGAVEISPTIYAWVVVFILPINSAVNPFLYTIATVITERSKKAKGVVKKKETSVITVETTT